MKIKRIFPISCLLILVLSSIQISAQSQNDQIVDPASVSGKVSVEGKPARNIPIGIFKAGDDRDGKPVSSAKTDSEGKYLIENIPFGSYYMRAEVPGFVYENEDAFDNMRRYYGRAVILEAGEKLKNIDIALVRGAVITGRLTDANGKPIIGAGIKLETFDRKSEKTFARFDWGGGMNLTDDRGVYRFYGLQAGKYVVSYGINTKEAGINTSAGVAKKSFYPLTFYPSVTNEKDAKIVEVGAGEVAENIDIRMGEKGSTFKIVGRLINEDTGRPLEKENVFAMISPAEKTLNYEISNSTVRSDGSFELNGLLPGKYLIEFRIYPEDSSEYYAPKTTVEIIDKNIEKLEIKAKKGLSVSGKVLLENKSTENLPVNLASVNLIMFGNQFGGQNYSISKQTNVKEDGSFRFTGLQPGEVRLSPANGILGLKIAKLEKDGISLESLKINEGHSINGLRVLIIYGTLKIQGEVRFENGEIPQGSQIRLIAKPTEQGRIDKTYAIADERGKFLLEGLSPGEYEVSVVIAGDNQGWNEDNPAAKKRIMLINGVNGQISFEINTEQNPAQ